MLVLCDYLKINNDKILIQLIEHYYKLNKKKNRKYDIYLSKQHESVIGIIVEEDVFLHSFQVSNKSDIYEKLLNKFNNDNVRMLLKYEIFRKDKLYMILNEKFKMEFGQDSKWSNEVYNKYLESHPIIKQDVKIKYKTLTLVK